MPPRRQEHADAAGITGLLSVSKARQRGRPRYRFRHYLIIVDFDNTMPTSPMPPRRLRYALNLIRSEYDDGDDDASLILSYMESSSFSPIFRHFLLRRRTFGWLADIITPRAIFSEVIDARERYIHLLRGAIWFDGYVLRQASPIFRHFPKVSASRVLSAFSCGAR